ncbi:hypothetical protein Acid345_0408 [Candidatus Koribacter versatilis Ellin345]|uniref:DUF883 domain-containing protein n=1 Tax=Koribacter versatilis (strain Ellin345) TaxID=204669 RepID=Q1IUN7_KORVE|nr:hypothetical protein [Candidatus Koribacter versatilis]ABF39413.1 hypothetical protein Acid345_0408 [Candidatus Koribacter versatilis Ellin345]
MADPLRNQSGIPAARAASKPIFDDRSVDELLAGFPADRSLPEAGNPRLNRAAESIGGALGTTVGRVRNGLTLVKGNLVETSNQITEQISDKASAIKDKVESQAHDLNITARAKAAEFGDVVQGTSEQLAGIAERQWLELRQNARQRLIMARNRAAVLKQDHPLELIAAFAGAAFVIGFAFRVWRSDHD